MAVTPGVLGRRYLPFIAVAAVQVLLVAIAPSKGPGNQSAAGVAAGSSTGRATTGTPGSGVAGPGTGVAGTDTTLAAITGGGAGLSGAGGGPVIGGGGANGTTGPGTSVVGDLSRCDPKTGKELGPTYYMPVCVPVWPGGDNGGATMTGVAADHINYVLYVPQANAEVNAILNLEGLAATARQQCTAAKAFDIEINKRWEHYGRRFVALDGPGQNSGAAAGGCGYKYFQGQCPLTPPDPACDRAEADVISAMKPAYVMAAVAPSPAFYDELAKKHIIVAGGQSQPEVYHENDAPYYYDVVMDGTRAASINAEYWCKRLVGKPVRWAGADVMTTRNWGPAPAVPPTRKLAVIYPSTNGDPSYKLSIDTFVSLITGKECSTPGGVLVLPYQSDITTAQQQSQTEVNELIARHITTVACFCDPIAPVFLTSTMSLNGYFPEQLLTGIGLIDYDILGRLYSSSEWAHAFGLSQLYLNKPFAQTDAALAFSDAGFAGLPDTTENLAWGYFSLMASSFQDAGPLVTPASLHQGLLNAPAQGGWALTHDQRYPLVKFAPPDPWTALEDEREIYWNAGRKSEVDGKAGSYCPVDGGHRYSLGEWPAGTPDVFDPAHNGC
jgi:hypothetical protein